MRAFMLFVLAMPAALTTGCGGKYVMTVPEQVAPAGGEARAVARLQRQEFAWYVPAVKETVLRFSVSNCPLRAAYTDKAGYAAVAVPVPQQAGLYTMTVAIQDTEGQEAQQQAPLYVIQKDSPLVAVDYNALPANLSEASPAAVALRKIAADYQIIYLTNQPVEKHERIHRQLKAAQIPDGPVLLWGGLSPAGRQGQVERLRESFASLCVGITDQDDGARAFEAGGLSTIMIGQENAHVANVVRYGDWSSLAQHGLARPGEQ